MSKPDLSDLFSHEQTWRDALEYISQKTHGDRDSQSYWEREIKVFNRTFEHLRKFEKEILALDEKPKYAMTIDQAIMALIKARQELDGTCIDAPTLILVLPEYGLATNVIDLVANKEDGSVRVIVR